MHTWLVKQRIFHWIDFTVSYNALTLEKDFTAAPKYIPNGAQVTARQTTTGGTKESVGNKYTRATEAGHSRGGGGNL